MQTAQLKYHEKAKERREFDAKHEVGSATELESAHVVKQNETSLNAVKQASQAKNKTASNRQSRKQA